MWKKMLVFVFIGLTGFMGFACGRKEVPLKPLVRIPPGVKPWPFRAVLIVPADTEHFHYWSPDKIPSGPLPNYDSVRPFTLPVGRAFAGAAHDTFAQIFREVTVKNQQTKTDGEGLVIESVLEEFLLQMAYTSFGPGLQETFLDIKGTIKARFRLNRPGKDFWENRVMAEIPPTRLLVNSWTEEEIGQLVAAGLAILYERISKKVAVMPESPTTPLSTWLTP